MNQKCAIKNPVSGLLVIWYVSCRNGAAHMAEWDNKLSLVSVPSKFIVSIANPFGPHPMNDLANTHMCQDVEELFCLILFLFC